MFRISTKTHGVIDYAVGAALAAVPEMMDCGPAARRMFRAGSISAAAYSAMTNYERGIVKLLPLQAHLALDAVSGAGFLTAALLLRDERPPVRALLAGVGAFEIMAAAMTSSRPYARGRARSPVERIRHRVAEYAH